MTSLREIALLKQLKHENIVRLSEVLVGSKFDSVFLAFEFCRIDLANLLDLQARGEVGFFTLAEVKCLLI